jgi:phosphate starvation-inducible protein PhoH
MVSFVLPILQIELEETTYFSGQVISLQQLALDPSSAVKLCGKKEKNKSRIRMLYNVSTNGKNNEEKGVILYCLFVYV